MAGYMSYGLTLTQGQKETLAKAARDGTGVTIRLTVDQLHGGDKLGLTKCQIAHIQKKKGEGAGAELHFSKSQMKHMSKKGGFLPLLALLPAIFGGLAAAGGVAGGAASIVKAVQGKQADSAAQAEQERHNREVESQLKGSGLYLKRGGCCPKCKGSGVFLSKN